MNALVVFLAQWLPVLIAIGAVGCAVGLPRRRLTALAIRAAGALAVAALLVAVASAGYDDPRPFVVDPAHPALLAHDPDNGFPSDHTTVTATLSLLAWTVRRWAGLLLLGLSAVSGMARVLANVHHVPDILAGLVIAAVSVGASSLLWSFFVGRRDRAGQPTEAGRAH